MLPVRSFYSCFTIIFQPPKNDTRIEMFQYFTIKSKLQKMPPVRASSILQFNQSSKTPTQTEVPLRATYLVHSTEAKKMHLEDLAQCLLPLFLDASTRISSPGQEPSFSKLAFFRLFSYSAYLPFIWLQIAITSPSLLFFKPKIVCSKQALRKQCQAFATALLDHTRSTFELEIILNHDPEVKTTRVAPIIILNLR